MNANPAGPDQSSAAGNALAAEYLSKELPAARRTLRRTQLTGVILILLLGVYTGVTSYIMVGFFEPEAAAEVANGMLNQHLASDGPVLQAQAEREIPKLIHETPDLLIKEIPAFRAQMETALTSDCQNYCTSLTRDFGTQMDQYIDAHQPEIRTLLENACDREAIRKTLPDFDKFITDALVKNQEGQAVKEHIDDWAASLKEVDQRVDRLANGQNLSPEELKARHMLALLASTIKQNTLLPETNSIVLLHPLDTVKH